MAQPAQPAHPNGARTDIRRAPFSRAVAPGPLIGNNRQRFRGAAPQPNHAIVADSTVFGQTPFISTTLVRSHVTNILTILNVANRTQAALVAQERQLVY